MSMHDKIARDYKNTNFTNCEVNTAISLGTQAHECHRWLSLRATVGFHMLARYRTPPESFSYHIILDLNFDVYTIYIGELVA